MNKTNKYLVAISATAMALPALSQSKHFEGSSVSLGLGSFQLKDASDAASKKWNGLGNIEFTKFQSLDDGWLVGFGVGLDVGTSRTRESSAAGGDTLFFSDPYSFSNPGALLPDSTNAYYGYQTGTARSIARKGNFSVSVLPAYAFTPNDMGYLRLSFNRAKFTVSGGGGNWLTAEQVRDAGGFYYPPDTGGDGCAAAGAGSDACTLTASAAGAVSGSKYLNGIGLGIGYRRNLQDNLFLQVEYKYVAYEKSDQLGIKPRDQGAVLSLGYRF